MTTLVTYYSLTGHTATVADAIAARLDAETDPIVEKTARRGLPSIAAGAMNALLGRSSPIAAPTRDPSEFDLVILGTPVWAAAQAPAVNAYIDRHRAALDRVAFFSTQGKPLDTVNLRELLAPLLDIALGALHRRQPRRVLAGQRLGQRAVETDEKPLLHQPRQERGRGHAQERQPRPGPGRIKQRLEIGLRQREQLPLDRLREGAALAPVVHNPDAPDTVLALPPVALNDHGLHQIGQTAADPGRVKRVSTLWPAVPAGQPRAVRSRPAGCLAPRSGRAHSAQWSRCSARKGPLGADDDQRRPR